jgi:hypothetical protein
VPETLDGIEFEQTQSGVALDDVEVGLLFFVQFGGVHRVGAILYAFAKAALLLEAGGAIVIEEIVEHCAVVVMVSGLGRAYGG